MPAPIVRVVPEDLWASGILVDGHAVELAGAHALTDARIDEALPYLPGLAAVAMAAKAEEWQATTAAFTGHLSDHAVTFHNDANSYVEADDSNAETLRNVDPGGSSIRFI
jgi:hypothetical protein